MAEATVLRKSDMQSLAGKLEKFAHELPEQEKNVLGWILARAEAASDAELSESQLDSVAGGQSTALSQQLAESAGFDAVDSEGESQITVGWAYRF